MNNDKHNAKLMLYLQNVSKTFKRRRSFKKIFSKPDNIFALSNVNITIEEKRFISILGSNGSGKTTLLRIAAGLLIPDSGKIICNSYDLVYVTANERQFQERLSGYENIRFYARLAGKKIAGIKEAALKCGIDSELLNQPVWTYTTGIKLRLALSRAFIGGVSEGMPKLILLDEPFRSLDLSSKLDLTKHLKKIISDNRASVIMAGHDIDAALHSDRVIILSKGRIIDDNASFSKEAVEKILEQDGRK